MQWTTLSINCIILCYNLVALFLWILRSSSNTSLSVSYFLIIFMLANAGHSYVVVGVISSLSDANSWGSNWLELIALTPRTSCHLSLFVSRLHSSVRLSIMTANLRMRYLCPQDTLSCKCNLKTQNWIFLFYIEEFNKYYKGLWSL